MWFLELASPLYASPPSRDEFAAGAAGVAVLDTLQLRGVMLLILDIWHLLVTTYLEKTQLQAGGSSGVRYGFRKNTRIPRRTGLQFVLEFKILMQHMPAYTLVKLGVNHHAVH